MKAVFYSLTDEQPMPRAQYDAVLQAWVADITVEEIPTLPQQIDRHSTMLPTTNVIEGIDLVFVVHGV